MIWKQAYVCYGTWSLQVSYDNAVLLDGKRNKVATLRCAEYIEAKSSLSYFDKEKKQ